MRWYYLVLFGVVSYALALAAMMPATIAFSWLELSSMKASGVRGTLLAGQIAALETLPDHRLEDVHWRLNPAVLLRGRLAVDLDFSYLGGAGTAQLSYSLSQELEVSDLNLELSAQALQDMLPLPLLELGGVVDARIGHAAIAMAELKEVDGQLLWRDAEVREPISADLGDVRVDVVPSNGGHSAKISGRGGVLDVDGEIVLTHAGDYRADIRLRPVPEAPAKLTRMLQATAKSGRDGSYRLRESGNVRNLL